MKNDINVMVDNSIVKNSAVRKILEKLLVDFNDFLYAKERHQLFMAVFADQDGWIAASVNFSKFGEEAKLAGALADEAARSWQTIKPEIKWFRASNVVFFGWAPLVLRCHKEGKKDLLQIFGLSFCVHGYGKPNPVVLDVLETVFARARSDFQKAGCAMTLEEIDGMKLAKKL